MLLRERVKQEIETLNEKQLSKTAEYILALKAQSQGTIQTKPFWESATPQERSQDFLEWISGLNRTRSTLSDTAFDRSSIYE